MTARTSVVYVYLRLTALPIANTDLLGHLVHVTETHTGPLPTNIVLTAAR